MSIVLLVASALVATQPGPPPAFSDCVWAGVSDPTKRTAVAALKKSLRNSALLARHDAEIRDSARTCAAGRAVTNYFIQAAAASAAIRQATAESLLETRSVTAAALSRAWSDAPAAARDCIRANAGRAFGQKQACSDPASAVEMIRSLGLDPRRDRAAFAAAAAYFNAAAQSEWADALVAYELARPAVSGRRAAQA